METPIVVDEKFENTADVGATGVGFARFLTMTAFKGKIYLDDTRFVHELQTYKTDKVTHNYSSSSQYEDPNLPTTSAGSTVPTVDGAVGFEGATAFPVKGDNGISVENNSQGAWKGTVNVKKEGEGATLNTFLRINDLYDSTNGDGGQPILLFTRPEYTGTDTTFVFEGKFRISPLADGTIKDGSSLIDITFRNDAGTRVYRTYLGDGKLGLNGKSGQASGLYKTGEWFTVRIEYTVTGDSYETSEFKVVAYVNGEKVLENTDKTTASSKKTGEDAATPDYAAATDVNKVGLLLSKDFVGKLDIDDIKLYQKAAE